MLKPSAYLRKPVLIALVFLLLEGLASSGSSAGIDPAGSEPELTTAIETVAAKVSPAVVSIQSEKIEHVQMYPPSYGSPFEHDLLDQFFADFFGEVPERELHRHSLGSGVIIDGQGHILTNEHVVRDTDKLTVTLADGREFLGTVKGTDPRSDLAVIKIDAPNLPFAELGDSDPLKIGQWVVAIGYPFGYILANSEPAVTTGVVSALHRNLPGGNHRGDTDYTDLIQTDAAINPGNSGGPLVNLNGQVIGINVAIFSTSGGYQGIGFTIPSNVAQRIVSHLVEGKKIEYGWIGVSVQDVSDRLAQYFGRPSTEGVLVNKVLLGGPADQGGLKDGDVILSIDGKPIKNTIALIKLIGGMQAEKELKLQVWRDKKTQGLAIKTAQRPTLDASGRIIVPSSPKKKEEEEELKSDKIAWRGLTIKEIPAAARTSRMLAGISGVIIVEVDKGSPAEEAGLRKAEIITSINKVPVKSLKEFNTQIKKASGDCLLRTPRGFYVVKER